MKFLAIKLPAIIHYVIGIQKEIFLFKPILQPTIRKLILRVQEELLLSKV